MSHVLPVLQASSPLALAIDLTENAKIGPVSATYASQASCPTSCPLKGAGCYAENGAVGFHTRRLNKTPATPEQVALAEAQAIEAKVSGRYDLRLHVVGDCPTNETAAIVSEAALSVLRHGRTAWSYSHAAADVERAAWGDVSVLASCETPTQIAAAQDAGWATALVVPEFPGDKLYKRDGMKILPCPNQTRGVTCVECRLCLNDGKLRDKGITIGFLAHGSRFKTVLRVLDAAGGLVPADDRARRPTLTKDGRKRASRHLITQ